MPWKTFAQDDEFCVHKMDEDGGKVGEPLGCHDTREEAEDQVAALYASEVKELKEALTSAQRGSLPDSAFLYVEPGCETASCRHLPYKNADGGVDLPHLRNAISRLAQEGTGTTGGESWLGDDLRKQLLSKARRILAEHGGEPADDKSFFEKVAAAVEKAITNVFGNSGRRSDAGTANNPDGVWLYKKGQGETLNWVVRYSNNYRDDDWPVREIISRDSHRKFDALIQAGVVPAPDLWLWHERDWKVGIGEWHAYDDLGFSIAGGRAIPEAEGVLEALAQKDDVRVSHGMPVRYISRDGSDDSIITEHITEEVSLLPNWAAANKYTGFGTYKEREMAITLEDKTRLMEQYGVSRDLLDKLESLNAADATKAAEELRDSKATGDATPPETPAPATPEPVAGPEADVVKALGDVLETVVHIGSEIKAMKAEIAALREADAAKVAQKAAQTPPASLASLAAAMKAGVIGNDSARVDGRSSLAKSGPAETEAPPARTVFGVPTIIDQWIQGNGEASRDSA